MDTAFRSYYSSGEMLGDLADDDAGAVLWAADMLRALSGGTPVATEEHECRIKTSLLSHVGTADAVCIERQMHADLKTGQKRNYREQMASYALGLMEKHFVDEWTSHLLFCDQRQVVTERWTFDSAKALVESVVSAVEDLQSKPKVCEYCSWCAKETTCATRVSTVEATLATTSDAFELVLADPSKLGAFLSACKIVDGFRDKAEEAARALLEQGGSVDGWKLGKGRSSEFVSAHAVYKHLNDLGGIAPVLESFGSMSGKKFRDLWKSELPIPEELIGTKTSKQTLIQCRS